MHVDDMAAASLYVMGIDHKAYQSNTEQMLSHINVGTGTDVSIKELALIVAKVTGFEGRLIFDSSKPDGAPRKLMDVSRLTNMGWTAAIDLEDGIRETWQWYRRRSETDIRAR